MLIVTVLLFIVGGGMLSTFLTGQASFMSGEAYVQVQQEARRAFDVMVRELREAQMSLGNPTTTLGNGSIQLNFQVALGYNTQTECQNPARTCWGGDGVVGDWLHYAIIGAGNTTQLVRYRNRIEVGTPPAPPCAAPTCRVLANNVQHPNTNSPSSPLFAYDLANKVVTINFQTAYNDRKLPGGRQATRVLSSRVKLRN